MSPPDTLVGARFVEAFRASGLDVPRQTVLTSSIQLDNGLLATGRFLGMLPDSLLWCSGKRFAIKALPIDLPVAPRLVGVVTLKNRTISPAARQFIQTAKEVTKPLAKVKYPGAAARQDQLSVAR